MNVLELLRKLVSFKTVNPPGNECECAQFIGNFLESLGFQTRFYEFAPERTSLVAQFQGISQDPEICFTGHLDVVSPGETPWAGPAFSAEIKDGKIFGRGTSDMKAGIAAMLAAAHRISKTSPALLEKILFVFTAGEETCCEGAYHLAGTDSALKKVKALVVGEPTSNYPLTGHKGCLRFDITTFGKAAHASMPELGDNAVYKAARAVQQLENLDFGIPPHPLLGSPTICIGRISGGKNINMVPDRTCIGVDIRIIPGQSHISVKQALEAVLDPKIEITLLEQAKSIVTDPENKWIQSVFSIMEKMLQKKIVAKAASYFTDASALHDALGNPPTVLLGPGEASMAHKTDEFCYISKISQAVDAYTAIIEQTI